jgi:hypothetical protein
MNLKKYWDYQWKKDKKELRSFCQNNKMDRAESCSEKYFRNDSSP